MGEDDYGQDFQVTYTLDSGQQGHIVLRLPQDASKRTVTQELAKYGLDSGLKDVVFQPVLPARGLRDKLPIELQQPGTFPAQTQEQTPAPAFQTPVDQPAHGAGSEPAQPPRSSIRIPDEPKRSGFFGLVKLALYLYLIAVIFNFPTMMDAYPHGREVPVSSADSDPLSRCIVNTENQFDPERLTDNPWHPQQTASFLGCIAGAIVGAAEVESE